MARKKGKHPGGRPPLPRAEKRSERIVALVRPAEMRKLERLAARRGVTLGELAREILESAVQRARSGK